MRSSRSIRIRCSNITTPRTSLSARRTGSRNYVNGPTGSRIIIMGGNKAVSITRIPLVQWYMTEFQQRISAAGAKLMVIGYSFSDQHINTAITPAVKRGLQLFIIAPAGVDVIDKRKPVLIKT